MNLDIRLLAMDVDGVLTDGGIIIHDDGSESKKFSARDEAWIRIWRRLGLKTAIITGRRCTAVDHRAKQLEIDFVYQDAHFKLDALKQLIADSNTPAEHIAYIGDDVMDLPVMREVGFAAAVRDAHPDLCDAADYVSTKPGGQGAVQEVIAYLLEQMHLMDDAMKRYRP